MGHVEEPPEARVESVMSRHVLCMDASDELLAAIRTMFSRRCSCVVVARDGKICGIFTERDVVRLAASRADSLSQMTIEEGMTPQVTAISPQTTLVDAARLMKKHDYRRFPVVSEDGTLLGLVTQSDIVSGIKSELEQYSHYLEREVEARTRSLKVVNDELARLSVTDPLTGLNNRRSLFHHM